MNQNHRAYAQIERNAARRNPSKEISMALIDNVDPALLDAYLSGQRITVQHTYACGDVETRTGTVSVSLGWTPVLLLIGRNGRRSSSDTLSSADKVTSGTRLQRV